MPDETNPLATPTPAPARDVTGTLLNQASPPTPTDTSSTSQTESTNQQTENQQKPEVDPSKTALNQGDKKPEQQVAPEKYADFKLPEGLTLEPKALEEATAVFKGLNLSQEGAQSLIDFHAKQMKSAMDAPVQSVIATKTAWESELKSTYGADIEPGGKVITSISRLIDTLPPKLATDFRTAMDRTLAGSNPAFVAAFAKLAERLGEGNSVRGNGPSPEGQKGPNSAPKTVAQAMYPHLPSANAQS